LAKALKVVSGRGGSRSCPRAAACVLGECSSEGMDEAGSAGKKPMQYAALGHVLGGEWTCRSSSPPLLFRCLHMHWLHKQRQHSKSKGRGTSEVHRPQFGQRVAASAHTRKRAPNAEPSPPTPTGRIKQTNELTGASAKLFCQDSAGSIISWYPRGP
jgi:hypothetical protein